jgi:hypothetical protein
MKIVRVTINIMGVLLAIAALFYLAMWIFALWVWAWVYIAMHYGWDPAVWFAWGTVGVMVIGTALAFRK